MIKNNNFKVLITSIFIFCFTLLVTACAVSPEEYKDQTPKMDMKRYFNGPLQAWGVFQDYREKVIKRFHVNMIGTWEDNIGTLEEDFTYSDGTTQRRVWTLVRIDDHNYSGTASDVIGQAIGESYGHALRWKYTLALDVDDNTYHVSFDDWMWLIDDNTVINRSIMSKFGVTLGEVILVFRKSPTGDMNNSNGFQKGGGFNMPEINNINYTPSAIL